MLIRLDQHAAAGVDKMTNVFLRTACAIKGYFDNNQPELSDNDETAMIAEYDNITLDCTCSA